MTWRWLLAGAGVIVATLVALAAVGALLLGHRGREDFVSMFGGRKPLESGRYCNLRDDCWDIERGEPATVWRVTPGGARFGDGIRARPSEWREYDFEIDHGRGRLQFSVVSRNSVNIRTRADGKTSEFDMYGRR